MSINRVSITGNLTRDPELRVTAAGTQVLSFGVAVNDRRRNPQTGEWEDYPNFVQRRSKLEVIVDEIEFMSQRQGGAAPAAAPVSTPAPAPAAIPPSVDLYDEDIPF